MDTTIYTSHAVIHLSIDAPDAKTLPVIVELDDPEHPAIALSVAHFARYLQRQGTRSYESIRKAVCAIGRLRDYYMLEKCGVGLGAAQLKGLLEDFLHAVDHGTALNWRPATNHQYITARTAVADYLKWVKDFEGIALRSSEVSFLEACRASWNSTAHAEKSLLFHTKARDKKKTAGRKKNVTGLKRYKPFPPHLVQELIETTKNPRDRLIFALIAYGGRRASELLHLFLEDFKSRGSDVKVELRHPVFAPMVWTNQAGLRVRGQRREYLKAMFGRLPRTEHGGLPTAAGWKGIKFDDQGAQTSEMYWIRDAGEFILRLHQTYLHGFRASVPKRRHPYYFVAENGEPLQMKALTKQFRLACARLEKRHGVSLKGYGPHSLRHFYGFYCADRLSLDLLLIQKYLGHMNPLSTAVYTHISPETAALALKGAERQQKGGEYLSVEDRAELKDKYRRMDFPDLQEALLNSTLFGMLDTRKLVRGLRG